MLKGPLKLGILIIGITMLAVSPLSASDQTDVIITRTNSSVESNRPVTVYIDDVRVGTLMPGKRLNIRVKNGSRAAHATLTQPRSNISSEYLNFTADDSKTLSITINVGETEEPGLIPFTTKKTTVVYVTLDDD